MELCRVGYALNAKKLRKKAVSLDKSLDGEWHGGGLGDILNMEDNSEGVIYSPFNADTDGVSMNCIYFIIYSSHYYIVIYICYHITCRCNTM